MKYALKSGLLAATLLALSAPALALNPLAEPPGVTHDPNVSIQHSNPTLTAPVPINCGAASGRANVIVGGTQAAGNMLAHASAGGGATSNGVMMSNGDKCATGASSMGAHTTAPVTGTPAH